MPSESWVSRSKIAKRLAISRPAVVRLAERGLIGTRSLPGTATLYFLPDAERLAAESTTTANSQGVKATDDPQPHVR